MKIIPYKQHNHIGYCVYFLYDKNEIVYIGYTFNLGKRLGEHSQWINSRENHRNELIKKHQPKYNKINYYRWVSTGKKYVCYKPSKRFGMKETKPKKTIYTIMYWKKTKKNRHWNYKK